MVMGIPQCTFSRGRCGGAMRWSRLELCCVPYPREECRLGFCFFFSFFLRLSTVGATVTAVLLCRTWDGSVGLVTN